MNDWQLQCRISPVLEFIEFSLFLTLITVTPVNVLLIPCNKLNFRQAAEIRANTRSRVKLSYTVHSTAQVCLKGTTLTALESSSKETDVSLCHSDTLLLLQCLCFGQHTNTNIKGILHRLAMSFDYYNNHLKQENPLWWHQMTPPACWSASELRVTISSCL